MHYKNGREAKENDQVIHQDTFDNAPVQAGTLHTLNADADTCNAQLAIPAIGMTNQVWVTVGNCLHAEDAMAAFVGAEAEPETAADPG